MGLDEALERWARWCHQGQIASACSVSQTALLMEILQTGITGPGNNGGGKGPVLDGVEPRIEAALMAIAASGDLGQRRARVLRAEYLMPVLDVRRAQEARAIRLGMALSQYKRDLRAVRQAVWKALAAPPGRT